MGTVRRRGDAWWILMTALAGAFLALGLLVLQLAMPGDPIPWECGVAGSPQCLVPPLVALGVGLALGGFVGRRALRAGRNMMTWLGGVVGALIGAVVGGTLGVIVEVASKDVPSGLAAFVIGAIAGGTVGAAVGGLAGHRSEMVDAQDGSATTV
ncbi:MAG TPA: hypothetical protein VFA25_08750 [Actinomycetota bacterium]|nr:hypothetical protein [Actinomycetota bacterium]